MSENKSERHLLSNSLKNVPVFFTDTIYISTLQNQIRLQERKEGEKELNGWETYRVFRDVFLHPLHHRTDHFHWKKQKDQKYCNIFLIVSLCKICTEDFTGLYFDRKNRYTTIVTKTRNFPLSDATDSNQSWFRLN